MMGHGRSRSVAYGHDTRAERAVVWYRSWWKRARHMRGKPHRKGHHARPRTIRPRTEEGSQPAAESGAATATATRRKCVLVVEDNATIGGLLVALLREEGYRAL